MPQQSPLEVDVVVFGGGASGLWLLDELHRQGCQALLLEKDQLGSGQTISSQGIIHGGLKYTLRGLFSRSARTIRDMPVIWRRCLAGEQMPDLGRTRLRSEFCYLWRTDSLTSRLSMIGARTGLRVTPVSLTDDERPEALMGCPGTVAILEEQVIEPVSFLETLADRQRGRVYRIDVDSGLEMTVEADGVALLRLLNPNTGAPLDIRPRLLVLTAGAGNESLRHMAGLSSEAMQRRPLHMAMLRGDLPWLNGHCVDGAVTRVTITSARDFANRTVWQLGGQIAENGVHMDRETLIHHARDELVAVLPELSLAGVEWSSYRVDRAEPRNVRKRRPDDIYALREGNVITAWPTKLALVPRLVEQILTLVADSPPRSSDAPSAFDDDDGGALSDWPQPAVAAPPWEINTTWYADSWAETDRH
jgi:glycine/D-amino acid oxidase-like deaminating enzyme